MGLSAWKALWPGDVELRIEDDRSDPAHAADCVRRLAFDCDVVLGPYSSTLTRAAAAALASTSTLLWNHGGAADDVQQSSPGHMISVLTPSRRYCEPFVRRISASMGVDRLLILHGRGGFARQVAAGAESLGRASGLAVDSLFIERESPIRSTAAPGERLALLCVSSFEEDVETVGRARSWNEPPLVVCAVAAGVRDFGVAAGDPTGVYGIAQWLPGEGTRSDVGPAEPRFIEAYRGLAGSPPDYPAAQAAASAALAVHCVEAAGSTDPAAVWGAAVRTRTRTFFGDFAIHGETGEQTAHETVLTLWIREGLSRVE